MNAFDAANILPEREAELSTISVHTDLASLASIWKRLESEGAMTPFQSFLWLSVWQEEIGRARGVTPAIVLLKRAGRAVALFPFAVTGGPIRRLIWLGEGLCDYNAPVLAPRSAVSLTRDWPRMRAAIDAALSRPVDLIDLGRMPQQVEGEDNPMLELAPLHSGERSCQFRLPRDWDNFYAHHRSAATRKKDRQKRRHLTELGPLCFVTHGAAEARCAAFERLAGYKVKTLHRTGALNFLARPGVRAFFRRIMTDPSAPQLISLSESYAGDMSIAAALALVRGGRYCLIMSSYDDGPAMAHGPGRAHLHALLAHTVHEGFAIFDFTVGDEAYKTEWCDIVAPLYTYRAALSARGRIALNAMTLYEKLRRKLAQSERARHLLIIWRRAGT